MKNEQINRWNELFILNAKCAVVKFLYDEQDDQDEIGSHGVRKKNKVIDMMVSLLFELFLLSKLCYN